jgi:hypothetical protein
MFSGLPPKPDSPNEFSDAAAPPAPQNDALRRRAVDVVPRFEFPKTAPSRA